MGSKFAFISQETCRYKLVENSWAKGEWKMIIKKITAVLMASAMMLSMAGCTAKESTTVASNVSSESSVYDGKLEFDHTMELKYAKQFSVDYYKGGYKLIKVTESSPILVVPENMSVPADVSKDTIVLKQPISNILVSSTPTTSLINAIGELDRISLTTYDVDSWYIDEVKNNMKAGKLSYIGSYKEPDYEAITAAGSTFGVFSTMLTDDVAEKLKSLGMSYICDQASNEDHPLARVEWAKLYGAMFNNEDAANELFAKQDKYVSDISSKPSTDKTAAIFYITSKGDLYARNTDDYMAKMISLAGGKYILDGKVGVGKTGTVKMEAESFYDGAKDADYIIYIWSMGGKPADLEALKAMSPIISDFKAVKEGNVFCTTPDYFQISCTIGNMINDINLMFNSDKSVDKFTYLYRLK